MEQIDQAQKDIKTDSVVTEDVSSALEKESNHENESLQNNTQNCTDNFKSDATFINECNTTESTRDVKNKNNGVTESLENMINEVEQIIANNDMQDNDDQRTNEECKENQIKKSIEVGTDLKCVQDTSMDKDNIKTSNDIETHNVNENEQQNACTVNDTNAQCQELIKTLSDTFENKDQSLHSQNTDTELSKLVDSSEVMVLTIEETIQVSTEERNIVCTVQEKDTVENSFELDNSIEQNKKEIKKSETVNEDFNLIDYSQESDRTIIEVISTEIMDSEMPEISTRVESNEVSNYVEKVSVTPTTPEVIKNDEISINIENDDSTNDDKYNSEDVEANDKNKTEICDSPHKTNANKEIVHNTNVASAYDNIEQQNVSESNKISSVKKRSVIQDIFDDWGDENTEEENQMESKEPDTVEIELKSLLNDTKTQTIEENTIVLVEEEIMCIEKDTHVESIVDVKNESQTQNEESESNQTAKNQLSQNSVLRSTKDHVNFSKSQSKSAKDSTHDTASSQTSSPQVQSVPVNRGRNLTSQIASSAEVTEALKERLREKQKVIETPPQPDIFFVKKLTQRLSSKLAGGPGSILPALIPLPQPPNQDKKQTDNTSNTGTSKESNTDNKELLAILEGDVDPDWSNLKPPTLTDEGKRPVRVESSGYNTPPKLDPSIERELALKQLLELPITSNKKSASSKKKTNKSATSKAIKEAKTKITSDAEKEVNVDESDTTNKPENESTDSVSSVEQSIEKKDAELQDARVDESRSGRKRKLTEKARENEHQQNIVKRQKVYRGKVSVNKKQSQAIETQADTDLTSDNQPKETTLSENENNANVTTKDEIIDKQTTNNNKMDSIPEKSEASSKTPKQNLSKKRSQSIAKKNIVAKKILKQNMLPNKKAALKRKLKASSKKQTGAKVAIKSRKSTEGSGDTKQKKKVQEIDRLLQDEGVVNLLYAVEQSDKKRLVNKSQAKPNYMDIQKVQRELKLRKKMVRNAVLRLRTSTSNVSKVTPRSKRTSMHLNDTQMDKKADQVPSKPTNLSASQEFILPAKIRNAADASIIIRRHSSSSFSSASASPRVSVDTPERSETTKVEEGGSHTLRSAKRRLSQEEKIIPAKKSKKKAVQKNDTALDATVAEIAKDKAIASPRPNKKTDSKKSEKNAKQPEAEEIGKIVTRSNGTATGKITSKTKKTTKNKVTFAKTSEQDNNEESSKREDELSACLAEAANALSVVNAGTRSGNSAVTRKGKANANIAKSLESDKTKMETRSQFSNKEINVRRQGNLVQLILTPSSSTKIKNALTLQVMQEFCETLSILKKDDDCRVVLLTSTGSSFCEGLELSPLLHTNKEERRIRAQELADAVKNFIKSLASFDKPIVAGVQGSAIGLGVTMLPLFDLVIASDKATFNTPYGKLGQIAEGAAVFTLSHILGTAITSELLIGGRTLTASEALRAGLVTRVLWPDRFQVELLPSLKAMSEQSSQSMEATKALLRHSLRKKLDAALESETFLLIKHWCSAECQTAIKAYIDGKVQ